MRIADRAAAGDARGLEARPGRLRPRRGVDGQDPRRGHAAPRRRHGDPALRRARLLAATRCWSGSTATRGRPAWSTAPRRCTTGARRRLTPTRAPTSSAVGHLNARPTGPSAGLGDPGARVPPRPLGDRARRRARDAGTRRAALRRRDPAESVARCCTCDDGPHAAPLGAVLRRDAPPTVAASHRRGAGARAARRSPTRLGSDGAAPARLLRRRRGARCPVLAGRARRRHALDPRGGARTRARREPRRAGRASRSGARRDPRDRPGPTRARVPRRPPARPPHRALATERLRISSDGLAGAPRARGGRCAGWSCTRPPPGPRVLLHRDFRTGNLMLDDDA